MGLMTATPDRLQDGTHVSGGLLNIRIKRLGEDKDSRRTGDRHLRCTVLVPLLASFLLPFRGRVAARRAEGGMEALDVTHKVMLARERLRALRVLTDVALLALVDGVDVHVPVVRPVEYY